MLRAYLPILMLVVVATGFAVVNLALTHLLNRTLPARKKFQRSKLSVYESGVQPIGNARQRFNIRFDLIAMLFIIFDIEIVFLYPWAMVFKKFLQNESGLFILFEMLIFIGILFLGYIYAWKKGGLTWD